MCRRRQDGDQQEEDRGQGDIPPEDAQKYGQHGNPQAGRWIRRRGQKPVKGREAADPRGAVVVGARIDIAVRQNLPAEGPVAVEAVGQPGKRPPEVSAVLRLEIQKSKHETVRT